MKKFALAVATFSLLFPVMSIAQSRRAASGEYTYYAAPNESLEQAKAIALERAKNQIIADNFGTVIGISNSTLVSNEDGKSDVRFLSFGESEVKGEWLETIGEPRFEPVFDPEKGMLAVKVKVKGIIREIKYSQTQFEARILRNGTDERFESDTFKDKDFFYLSFESPESGYLAVFLYDGKIVNRLLPLPGSTQGSCEVVGGKKYLFFERPGGKSIYHMTCGQQAEINRFYIVFSPNRFSRPLDSNSEGQLAELSFENFNHWLAKCRKQDVRMSVQHKDITLSGQ